jgi:hypothetical protein
MADGPIEQDGFLIEWQGGPELGGQNPGLQLFKECRVTRRE